MHTKNLEKRKNWQLEDGETTIKHLQEAEYEANDPRHVVLHSEGFRRR